MIPKNVPTSKEFLELAYALKAYAGRGEAVPTAAGSRNRPLVALHTYHGAVGAAETQQLLDDYSEVRQAAVANWEALRKLVKKFDKNAPEADALSGELLPKLYASSLTSLVHADDVFPFETLKALAHPVNSDGEEAESKRIYVGSVGIIRKESVMK